ncbi:unnamed protein product [Amoebophrya sp. A25]|nr:unnamed protein product [Amoebophrya sp. A25]|eukprot:GSA25T00010033001.1
MRADQLVRDEEELGPLERHKLYEAEAKELAALYDLQLQELTACQQLLLADQERFAYLLADHSNRFDEVHNGEEDEQARYTDEWNMMAATNRRLKTEHSKYILSREVQLLKILREGLDLRVQELIEDSRRIERTEERLRRKIFLAIQEYEIALLCSTGLVSSTALLRRMRQQERVLGRQQEVLDQLRFHRDLEEDECKRLRQIALQNLHEDLLGSEEERKAGEMGAAVVSVV